VYPFKCPKVVFRFVGIGLAAVYKNAIALLEIVGFAVVIQFSLSACNNEKEV
jgi:hypothetical protein